MDTVRWGIIGVGNVTEVKSGPGFQRAERSELVAVMRRDGVKAADYARRHGVSRWYDDAQALLDDPEVDAVYVATPPDTHCHYAVRALEAGKPVYVEKPMARTTEECTTMLAAAKRTGQPLFVAYYRRAMPRFGTVEQLLDDGAIGTVQAVAVHASKPAVIDDGADASWRVRPEVSGGGHFVDLASHTLDLLDHLLGPVTRVTGYATRFGRATLAEDAVSAAFEFESGALGTGLWSYGTREHRDEVRILGSAGSIRFSTFGEEPITLVTEDGERRIEAPYPATVQQPLIQTVVDELTGHGMCPSTGESAIRTSRVIDTLLAEYRAAHGVTIT